MTARRFLLPTLFGLTLLAPVALAQSGAARSVSEDPLAPFGRFVGGAWESEGDFHVRVVYLDNGQEREVLDQTNETLVFGRLAMGEARIEASLRDCWRLRRAGRLVFADAMRLDHAGLTLDRPAAGAGARAVATILAAAPNVEARLFDLRAALDAASVIVESGATAFDGLLVYRLMSASPSRLRDAVIAAIVCLSKREPPRLWR